MFYPITVHILVVFVSHLFYFVAILCPSLVTHITTFLLNFNNLVDMSFYAITKKGCLSMVTFFRISSFFGNLIHFSTFYKSSWFLRSSRIFYCFLAVLFYLYSISFFVSVYSINLVANSLYFSLIWHQFMSLFRCLFITIFMSFPLIWWICRFMQSLKKGA